MDDRVANQLAALSPDGVVVTDGTGRYRWANLAAARLVGLDDPAGLLGRSALDDAGTADSRTVAAARCRAVLAGETVRSSMEFVRHADGHLVPVEISSAPYDLDGGPAVLSVVRDLSERFAAEATESALHLQHETTLETLAEGVVLWSVDQAGNLSPLLINSAMRDIFGPDVANLVCGFAGLTDAPRMRDASGNPITAAELAFRVTATTGRRIDGFVVGVEVPGAGLVWVRAASRPVLTPEDEVVGVVLSMTDITSEHEAARQLRSAHARFSALVEHSSDVITVLDAEGLVRYASPAYRSVYGEDPAERIGRRLEERVHHDDRRTLRAALGALADTVGATISVDCRVVREDGTVRFLEVTATNHLTDPAVGGIVVNSRDVTERVQTANRLAHQALHDPLTGLSNRAALDGRLPIAMSHAQRTGVPFALLFVDLDHFKLVNDSAGHQAGDDLLVAVAARLSEHQRSDDLICRLGGDEFVVLVDDVGTVDTATAIAERIRRAVRQPVRLGDVKRRVTCSIGIALSDGGPPERMLHRADLALYEAKASGRDCWVVHRPTDEAGLRRRPIGSIVAGSRLGREPGTHPAALAPVGTSFS